MAPRNKSPLFPAFLFLKSDESGWPQHCAQSKGKFPLALPYCAIALGPAGRAPMWGPRGKWVAAFGQWLPCASQKPQGDEWVLWALAYIYLDLIIESETSGEKKRDQFLFSTPSVKVVLEIPFNNSKQCLSDWPLSNTERYYVFRESQQGFCLKKA